MPDQPSLLLFGFGEVARRTRARLAAFASLDAGVAPESAGDFRAWDAIAVVSDRPLPRLAERIDELCWAAETPWCEATLIAHEWRVGPVIRPGRTPCYECWTRRVASHVDDPEGHHLLDTFARENASSWFRGRLEALDEQVVSILAAELLALALSTDAPVGTERGMGRYWTGDAVYGAPESHRYSRLGGCPRCGKAGDYAQRLASVFEAQ